MKRSRTLASYFRPIIDESPAPSVPEQETNGYAPPPSQGTEEETLGTKVSGTQIQRNQFDPLGLAQETITSSTSVPTTAVELRQPPVEQRTVGIEASNENVGFEEGSNHVFGPEDIIVDPGLRKPIYGLQRKILDKNPYAFYIHCFAHQLQLVVVSVAMCCSSVFDFFNIISLIVNTVNASCKRRDQLSQHHHDNIVNQLDSGQFFSGRGKNQETNLARAGDTRWGSHHKTLCRLEHMWDAVLEVLENIAEDGVGDKKTTASGLLLQMENFEFVLILHLMIKLLGITNDLSQCLQRKDQNIVRAVGLIGITLEKINDVRQHGWEELFEEVKEFCAINHIIIPNMEEKLTIRGRSRGRGGQQVTYYHHFKNEIFNVVHDQVIVELNNRFAERSTQLLRCIACLDPKNSFANYDREKLVELAEIYDADFSHYEISKLRNQLDNFITDVRADPDFTNCVDLGVLAMKMVQTDRHTTFSLVYRLIELALILPVATATVERAFSAMKIIKTELRNRMGDEWLNYRMICYIEREIFASIKNDDILHYFQELKTRLKKLPKQSSTTTCDEEMEDVTVNAPNSH